MSEKKISEQLNEIIEGLTKFTINTGEKINNVTAAYPYQVKHEPIITSTLQQTHESIVLEYPELKYMSFYGARIELKSGEVLPINKSICKKAFINEVEYSSDYTYTGSNEEIITAFYFADENTGLNLPIINIDTLDIYIKEGVGVLNIDKSWHSVANNLKIEGDIDVSATYCNNYSGNITLTGDPKYIPGNMKTFIAYFKSMGHNNGFFGGKTLCKQINLPELETIETSSYSCQIIAPTTDCTISIPKLKTTNNKAGGGVISGFKNIVLPNTLQEVKDKSFGNISNIFDFTNITNTTFSTDWYAVRTGALVVPNIIIFPEDWKCSINLAKIGTKQQLDWYIELFDKLHDYTGQETHYLTIPKIIYDEIDSELLDAITEQKKWSISGA